jgi:hypothetical protein
MLRRITPLLIALAIAGAPVALELCHIACASLPAQLGIATAAHGDASHTASCHEAAELPAPLSLHAHPCGHGDDLPAPAGIESARHSKFGTSLAATVPAIGSIPATPLHAHMRPRSGASDRSAARNDLILPLRI